MVKGPIVESGLRCALGMPRGRAWQRLRSTWDVHPIPVTDGACQDRSVPNLSIAGSGDYKQLAPMDAEQFAEYAKQVSEGSIII